MIQAKTKFLLKIPGDPKYVGVVRLTISGLASRLELSYEDVEDIKLAVAEACSRAIAHGNNSEISIECEVLEDSLLVSVEDPGTTPLEDEDLGLILIRSLMDEVQCEFPNNVGCRFTMKKHFNKSRDGNP